MLEVMAIENSESWNFWAVKVGVLRVSFISFSVEFEVHAEKKLRIKLRMKQLPNLPLRHKESPHLPKVP